MGLSGYLSLPFAQHALMAGTLIAVICGLIGPFVVMRQMAFAVHGAAELSFTGAAAGLVVSGNPVAGALIGSLVVAGLIGSLGERPRERDSTIGVILAAGLGLGVLLLSHYQGFATAATNILFGDILGISTGQVLLLVGLAIGVLVVMTAIYRPLLFSSVDPELASARGVPTRMLGIVFLVVLALTVTEAAQVVGTLLVLSLAITPAAAAQRLASTPLAVTGLSIGIALVATDGGILMSLTGTSVPPTVFVSGLSFAAYLVARLGGPTLSRRRRERLEVARRTAATSLPS
jgi:zinc/manganese transport system permease protein